MNLACPLCTSSSTSWILDDRHRSYHQCRDCDLIFVPEDFHLSKQAEKEIYDLHENSPDDVGYQRFLNKLLTPLCEKLEPPSKGLDFGCGPGPTIKPMLEPLGYTVSNYDLYYANDKALLKHQYNFITCTEAIEHFVDPRAELELFDSMLMTGGLLGIMTKRVTSIEAFSTWHYKNDPTHVSFFSESTLCWVAQWLNYTVEFPGNDTAIFRKRSA